MNTVFMFTGRVNLARDKPAEQSSTLGPAYSASRAVNGVTQGSLEFSHTNSEDVIKWWKVDLKNKYTIGEIKLYNREVLSKFNFFFSYKFKSYKA